MSLPEPVLVVGAGVAGLACARGLAAAGRPALVLEKSRGIGGRCATRRVNGAPVDHGLAFLHGSHPDFLAALEEVSAATPLPGWPLRIAGRGRPCQADAFAAGQVRRAYVEGVKAFPRHLAGELSVRLQQEVTGLAADADGWTLTVSAGAPLAARDLVLALPGEQARRLLAAANLPGREIAAAVEILRLAGSLPCLTLLAGYAGGGTAPDWDVLYPDDSAILQLVSHDSAKRPGADATVLVLQARPGWSRQRLAIEPAGWTRELLVEAGRVIGPWAAGPTWAQAHRWALARVDRGSELTRPLLLRGPAGVRLGLAGELFAPGGGVQAAWLSGRELARRLLQED